MKPWGVSVHIIEPGLFHTGIVDQSIHKKQLQTLWNSQTEETKQAYGEEYYNHSRTKTCHMDTFWHVEEREYLYGCANISKGYVRRVEGIC